MLTLILAKDPPNPEALALGPTIGWLVFACVLAFAAIVLLDLDRWRRFWMRTEDPRSIAAFRVAFAAILLINVNNMWPHFELLFTDEGLFMTDSARQHLAGRQFAGYGEGLDGEPRGFFDLAALGTWALGPRYSLLYFWDSPRAFWTIAAIWEIATISFLLGFRTRIAGIVSLVLTLGFMGRNPIYMSGADVVFRVMFVYLVMAKSGHAYSVDNWLRCRRLGEPGALEAAIYRRIPAWPRMLIILQLGVIYFWTGCAKNGHVWWRGDSLYYALNLDHFNRVPTQFLGYVFGTNVFRLMTWTVHFWQIGFPIMILGLIVRWARREGLEPPSGARRWGLRAAWLTLSLAALAILWVGLPVHVPVDKPGIPAVRTFQWLSLAGGLALIAGVAWGWYRLRERPFRASIRGREYTLDLERFFTIVAGRRLWLTLGLIFHLHIFALMNIGMFAPVMIVSYLACLNGSEIATACFSLRRSQETRNLRFLRSHCASRLPRVTRGRRIIPSEPVDAPHLHHDTRRIPSAVLLASFALVSAGILAKVHEHRLYWAPIVLGVLLPLGFAIYQRLRFGRPRQGEREYTWAYGWFGRAWVGTFIAVHLAAVAAWSIPAKDCTASFRKPARELIRPYMNMTQTYQSWNMFAPNPSRANVFMKVFVTDEDGQVWDLYTDANSPRNKTNPWFFYDRMGKITRKVTGEATHYQKWVARYHCRKWALDHGGELPSSVEIIKQWYVVPPPEKLRARGPYQPADYLAAHGRQKRVYRARCATEPDAQPSNEIRRRHGLPAVPEEQIRRAVKPRYERWQRRNQPMN
ncbi:MAG: hypothetical protein R6X02_06585 [Enhygromyxa sp.]